MAATLPLLTGCYGVEGIAVGMSSHPDKGTGNTDDTETAEIAADGTETAGTPTDVTETEDPTSDTREVEEVLITFDADGWISSEDNGIGIQGGWYPAADRGDSSLDTYTFESTISICLEGKVVPPQDGADFQNYYGAKMIFDICADGNRAKTADLNAYSAADCPYNAKLADQIAGVKVNISGTQLPTTQLRLQFNEQGRTDGTYVILEGEGEHTAMLSEAKIEYDTAADPIDNGAINAINFYVASAGGPSDFNFCINNIRILVYR